jgi:CheY-like chemotaxis protein
MWRRRQIGSYLAFSRLDPATTGPERDGDVDIITISRFFIGPLSAFVASQCIASLIKFRLQTMSPNLLSNLTIVVVEDHDDARRYLGLFLDGLGATVLLASNGFEGLQAIKDCSPNLVVSDIQMPGMNGFELLRAIRAFGPDAGGNVPVIAMTTFVTNVDRAHILNTGFQECLPKPFTPDKLTEVILMVLS